MTITQDQLKACAERCGMRWSTLDVCDLPCPRIGYGMDIYEPDWLLTPDGREAMEKALLAQGYQIHSTLSIEGAGVSIRRIGDKWTDAEADSPASALVLAICGLPKVQP
jgi:hypothetical protein